jgi:hypothetical protein
VIAGASIILSEDRQQQPLVTGDQAEIPDTALPGIMDKLEQGQAIRTGKRMAFQGKHLSLVIGQEASRQPVSLSRVRHSQMSGLVSYGR